MVEAPLYIVDALKKRFPGLTDATLFLDALPLQVVFFTKNDEHVSCIVTLGASVRIGKCRFVHA